MIRPTLEQEQQLWRQGLLVVAGVDEVGRGCLAGPVVAGAVVLPSDLSDLPPLWRDSKTLSVAQRQQAAAEIKQLAQAWAVGQAEVVEIDALGIVAATFLAMERALAALDEPVDRLLVDGAPYPGWPVDRQLARPKADATMASVAAASIVAKVYRDELMDGLSLEYPEFGLAQHKGYGTASHVAAVRQYGYSPIHRRSFKLKVLEA